MNRRLQLLALSALGVGAAVYSLLGLPFGSRPNPVQAVPAPVPELATTTSAPEPNEPTPPGAAELEGTAISAWTSGLAGVSALLDSGDPVSILVFGDGSGDDPDEWVHTWAVGHVAKSHPVSYRSWDAGAGTWRRTDPSGGAGALTIWNASVPFPDLPDEPARVAKASKPADVVLLSYGHGETADEIRTGLTAIHQAVLEENPEAIVIVMLQNPALAPDDSVERSATAAVAKWADAADIETVDVYGAFANDPAPRSELVEAGGNPTTAGSRLWAATLQSAIDDA